MSEFLKIDLQAVFNHKAILEDKSLVSVTGLTELGLGALKSFFKSSYYPKISEIVEIKGVPFVFPNNNIDSYDNIQCAGQVISLPKGRYSKAYTISFNEFVDSEDLLELLFSDGSKETINLHTICWGTAGLKNNRFTFINEIFGGNEGVLHGKSTNMTDVGCTFSNLDIINGNLFLSEILLPYNPALHIFSITLEINNACVHCTGRCK